MRLDPPADKLGLQASPLAAALADRYRLERELGAGGMATVYLAEDLRHDRRVAIKVLKPELAAVLGAERFITEIKTTAALQHPHILPLFDSGTAGGFLYYVMPYVEGETIREKLSRETQFGVEDAVRIAREIADALDYAHRHGVIHRDIKPENILLHDGRAMVMDFGIALAVSAAAGGRMTETGLSLGTPHYMSPEQATAEREITARSDVYSLASVLYEMLAGDPPFTAASAQAVIMRIITEPAPPVTARRRTVPPNVAAALATALEKLPADRFESARAFANALSNAAFATTVTRGATRPTPAVPALGRRERAAWAAAVVGLAAVAGWLALRPSAAPPPLGHPVKFELALPDVFGLGSGIGAELALTTDGRTLVYHAQGSNGSRLARRAMDDTVGVVIDGTDRAGGFALSPDGKWVVFFVDSLVKKVPIEGGPPTTLATYAGTHASWGPNGVIVLGGPRAGDGLWRIPAAGGRPRRVAAPDTARREANMRWPRLLADGQTVLYTSWPASGVLVDARIGLASLESSGTTVLDLPGGYAFGVFDGHLVYARPDGPIMAVRIDVRRRRLAGEPFVLVGGVSIGLAGASKATISDDGTLLYVAGNNDRNLVVVNRAGGVQSLATTADLYGHPRFSPNGTQIAVSVYDRVGGGDIWVIDREGGTRSKLVGAGTPPHYYAPEWTPDGKRLLFVSGKVTGMGQLMSQTADGSAAAEPVGAFDTVANWRGGFAMSRDGRTLVSAIGSRNAMDIWYRSAAGDTAPKPVLASPAGEYAPALSPDGKWLAYVSDETGEEEVYVRAFPGPPSKWPVSVGGGSEPVWSRDGRHIYYRAAAARTLVEATVTTSPAFAVTGRAVLFDDPYMRAPRGASDYDVSPDGTAFLMIRRGTVEAKLMGIVNFLGALHGARLAR